MKREQVIKIATVVSGAVIAACTIGGTAFFGGAMGMAYSLYGAVLGTIIGAAIAYAIDHSFESMGLGASIGLAVGSIIGVAMEKMRPDHEGDRDVPNLAQVPGCVMETALNNVTQIINCSTNLEGCGTLFSTIHQIPQCMGADQNIDAA